MIALLTDFGESEYAGIMKGVVLRLNPRAVMVDLTHHIGRGQAGIRQGAWKLLHAYRHFPKGTVFLCVVDPGVGTERKAVADKAGGYYFVGPDNGLMYPAILDAARANAVETASKGSASVPRHEGQMPKWRAVSLPIPADASSTFHGRDVFAPAAALVESGRRLESLGSPVDRLVEMDLSPRERSGEVVDIDWFGNLITNLPPTGKTQYWMKLPTREGPISVRKTYAEGVPGEIFLVVGSCGTLEVSARDASAQAITGAHLGDPCALL